MSDPKNKIKLEYIEPGRVFYKNGERAFRLRKTYGGGCISIVYLKSLIETWEFPDVEVTPTAQFICGRKKK